ncbi:hypothetical protein [uncultured Methylobacterium sp.]|mgnify:CR=1 FL=1|jgi:hypothetical protein|uniref:hypothetical protein n=1 Tax=uncultured Methylobacterium sp. TaxID=157278 RepID=UPI00263379EC|nr:hypothetical protein [uncultured Methylobacterium sp.]
MAGLLTVALICASTVLAQDCTRDTALDVIVAPAASEMTCLMQGETLAASSQALRGPDRYLKVSCERRKVRSATATPGE